MAPPIDNQQEGPPITPRHPSGLFNALDKVGRVRGSSATPEPQTAKTPLSAKDPEIREQLLQRLRDMPSVEDFRKSSGPLSAEALKSLHTRNASDGTEISEDSAVTYQAQKTPNVNELATELQGRLNGLVDRLKSANMPTPPQSTLINEIKAIGNNFRNREKRLQEEIGLIVMERDSFRRRLVDARGQLRTTKAERDQNRNDYQDLFRDVEDLRAKTRKHDAALLAAKNHFAEETAKLNLKIQQQDEQLRGKRALWLDTNPRLSARRSAMTAAVVGDPTYIGGTGGDPFQSPSAHNVSFDSVNTSFGSGNMGNMLSPTSTPYTSFDSQTPFDATPPKMKLRTTSTPQGLRRRGTMQTGNPSSHRRNPSIQARNISMQHSPGHGNLGSPGYNPMGSSFAQALAQFTEDDDIDNAPQFRQMLTHLYIFMEGWARKHTNVPNPEVENDIKKHDRALWEFMMDCTYPSNRKDAYAHASAVISDPTSRYWFIMRMVCQYIFPEMVAIKGWHGFSKSTDEELDKIATKFQERGLQNEARQELVDERVKVIQEIVADPLFNEWRAVQLNHHTKQLRILVSKLLNQDSDRLDAGRDLGVLAIKAWEMSTQMNLAPVSFQIYFPETNGKFSTTSMMAKDQPGVDPMILQVKQTRLKLVVTPVVTLRDDRGTTIKAKSLLLSTVLTMQ